MDLPLVIVLTAFLPKGFISMSLILGLVSWPEIARILRSQTMKMRSREYILSIQAMGVESLVCHPHSCYQRITSLL